MYIQMNEADSSWRSFPTNERLSLNSMHLNYL